ncbi:hypothetical protein BH18ACT11_BH18ACT11_01740 [soil metagenome]
MTDRPGEGREERRRTGPLGDDDETRQVPTENDPEATRRVPTQRASQGSSEPEETRIIRAPNRPDTVREATPYPRGYFEEAEEREDRLRDMYGGVDWLASFLGFVFTLVLGAVFSSVTGLLLVPFGFSPDFSDGQLGTSVITGLAVLAVLIFLTYFFGGYVAGRLARFDGGRNGAMVLAWTFIVVLILTLVAVVFSGFLPAGIAVGVGNLAQATARAASNLAGAGLAGIVAAAAALLVALLGGFLGGRMGSRYHTEIDRAS